jgi:hypothetical protein
MDAMTVPSLDLSDVERSARQRRRVVAAILVLATGSLLLVAAWLSPAEGGHGTHTQMGLPPCGWVVGMGIPCPSCGMTTSFAHAANGNLLGALKAQPAGAVLALGTAMVLVLSSWVLWTGSAIGAFWFERLGRRFFILGGLLVLGAWIYKIITF